jgi:hypothetical protein
MKEINKHFPDARWSQGRMHFKDETLWLLEWCNPYSNKYQIIGFGPTRTAVKQQVLKKLKKHVKG